MTSFRRYESRPITRLAYEIQEDDPINALPDSTYHIVVDAQDVFFKAYQTPLPGDFVVYLNDEDIYHVARGVFIERNIVPGAPEDLEES